MTGDVIKSFLVGLGFKVDDGSLGKFNKALGNAALKVTALYGSMKLLSSAIVYSISKISEGFEQMGYEYRIIAPAINKALLLRKEMLKAYSAAGVNITKVVQSAVKLNLSLDKTKIALEVLYKSVASRFFGLLTKQSDAFRKSIYANMPKIQKTLERFIQFTFKAVEALQILGMRLWSILGRVYDFFVMLDKATDGWSTAVIALVAAWKLLNLSFLLSPIGAFFLAMVGLLALFDDFKTWQEGGESLFDWSSFLPVIEAVTALLGALWERLKILGNTALDVFHAFKGLFSGDFSAFIDNMIQAVSRLTGLFFNLWDAVSKGAGVFSALGTWGSKLFGGNAAANVQNAASGGVAPPVSPVGGAVQNSQSNQNVNQQTNINVSGSADAGAIGQAVAGQQNRVNFDMVRNMKGATR